MEKILLFGAGSHANVVANIVEKQNKYKIAGFIDSKRNVGSQFNDYYILGRQENLKEIIKKYDIYGGFVCVGDNYQRYIFVNNILNIVPDFNFVTIIDPSVLISKYVKIGKGVLLAQFVAVDTYAEISDHCIIFACSTLAHNCKMERFSSFATGIMCGGYFTLKEFSAITIGVTLFDRITIGEHTVIGSGSLVTKDIPAYCLAYGSPAKIIRKREIGEKYLK